jgi:alpha-tubulin suppressor-like RCC1 family protein
MILPAQRTHYHSKMKIPNDYSLDYDARVNSVKLRMRRLFFNGAILLGGLMTARAANEIVAWGQDAGFGELKIPSGLTNVVSIAAGLRHNLALKADGTVVTWGCCLQGNGILRTTTPEGLSNVTAIAAGMWHSLALKSDGTVVGWGYNGDGEIDIPPGLTNVNAIACGNTHSVALKSNGLIVCWGAEGASRKQIITVPSDLTNAMAIAGGNGFSMALRKDGTVIVWGDDNYGVTNIPPETTNVFAIVAGSHYCLALKQDGRVVGWGCDVNGAAVTPPADLTDAVAVAAGEQHRVALRASGTIAVWGRGWGGTTLLPPGLTNVIAISSCGYHTLALKGEKVKLLPIHTTQTNAISPALRVHWQEFVTLVGLAALGTALLFWRKVRIQR